MLPSVKSLILAGDSIRSLSIVRSGARKGRVCLCMVEFRGADVLGVSDSEGGGSWPEGLGVVNTYPASQLGANKLWCEYSFDIWGEIIFKMLYLVVLANELQTCQDYGPSNVRHTAEHSLKLRYGRPRESTSRRCHACLCVSDNIVCLYWRLIRQTEQHLDTSTWGKSRVTWDRDTDW